MIFPDGLRLSVTTLTVLPVRAGRVDRATAEVAMSVAPAVGALLGLVLAGLLWLLREAHAPAMVAGAVTVAAAALLTRGMHLDGLADTTDALGSYRAGDQALEIMKKSDIGPFGVAAIALTLLIQTAALADLYLSARVSGSALLAVIVAFAAGRAAIPIACRRGVPAARPEGLGALVAGTVPVPFALGAAAIVVTVAAAIPDRLWWQGPLAVVVSLLAVAVLVRHAVRRFGGITGDVLGAAVEVATTLALIGLTLS